MKETIYTTYAPDTDITFIMKDVQYDEGYVSTEVMGWYFGKEDEKSTKIYSGSLKAYY
jgi:hypothetical protein